MDGKTNTIVLIHGLWMTPRSWDPFRGYYEGRGYRVLTPAWPQMKGEVEEVRRDPSALAGLGLLEIADHYEKFVRSLDEPPIVMGHSMGGLVVQILLDRGLGAAGVSIDGAAPKGIYRLPLSVIKAASPVLSNPFNYRRNVALTFDQFRYAFAHVMTEKDARAAYDNNAIPGPGRTIFQVAFGNLNPRAANKVNHGNSERVPLLLINGAEDHLIPPILNRINYKLYKRSTAVTDYKEFPNRSHLIVAQDGWQEVAEYALSWVEANIGGDALRKAA
ncbi:MAG TPA: alpha/beta hydrolase [Nitrospirota bacterium]|nr:alpha/beta hydrolase [Nitrospirota bacterium]